MVNGVGVMGWGELSARGNFERDGRAQFWGGSDFIRCLLTNVSVRMGLVELSALNRGGVVMDRIIFLAKDSAPLIVHPTRAPH